MKNSILIIDDDKELGEITSDMLEAYGYEVTKVLDSTEAYEILSNKVFQLIILDINLPFETGSAKRLVLKKSGKEEISSSEYLLCITGR